MTKQRGACDICRMKITEEMIDDAVNVLDEIVALAKRGEASK